MCTVELIWYFVVFSKFLRPQKYPGFKKKNLHTFYKKRFFYQKYSHAGHNLLKLIYFKINVLMTH